MKTLSSKQLVQASEVKLLNKQLSCCKRLLDLSRQQKEAIQSDDSEAIKKIIDEKEKIIEEYRNIQESYQQFENPSSKLNHSPPAKAGGKINDLIKKIDAVLKELHLMEEECEKALSRRCGEIKEEIAQTKRGRRVLKRFSPSSVNSQSFGAIDGKA